MGGERGDAISFAEMIFNRIGDGHRNAVGRPDDLNVDRKLRALIEHANHNGDCIISGKNGYYRPIPGNEIDEAEYKIYMRQNKSRIDKLKSKQACMNVAFEMKRLEIWYAQEMRKDRNDK